MRIERHEQIIARLPQLLHGNHRRALDHPSFVVLQNSPENGGRDSLGHLELAPVVRVSELDSRAEHPTEHRVGVGDEQGRVDHEAGVVHDKGDTVLGAGDG